MAKSAQDDYPLHWSVWHNEYRYVDELCIKAGIECEALLSVKDPRGRTPLELAVVLGHLESTKVLLNRGADPLVENSKNWTVLQEAVSTGDPELVSLMLKARDSKRAEGRASGIPSVLAKLREAPDFYVEMKWEFTSWVPLVSRMCPSDTYRLWKSGSRVRIDTTLLGFDNMSWHRGARSFVFKGDGDVAEILEVDHDSKQVYVDTVRGNEDDLHSEPTEEQISARLTSPLVTTFIDTEKISFERSKSGIWGWRSEKSEVVSGHDCKVFGASNVELITKTRSEHLSTQDKERFKKEKSQNPLEKIFVAAEKESPSYSAEQAHSSTKVNNPCSISAENYFNPLFDLEGRDIGRPHEEKTKVQKFKASLWLCENYPLSLQEQVVPIIDLMSQSNAHFKKLKDFITLQLPAGFPVKIEIPLFHVLNARITFGNICARTTPAEGVTTLNDVTDGLLCVVDDSVFDIPAGYVRLGEHSGVPRGLDEDDQLLQFAIQQSLRENGPSDDQVTFYESINAPAPAPRGVGRQHFDDDADLQRAIEASLCLSTAGGVASSTTVNQSPGTLIEPMSAEEERAEDEAPPPDGAGCSFTRDLALAMKLSQQDVSLDERRRQDEEEELQRILQLSLQEK